MVKHFFYFLGSVVAYACTIHTRKCLLVYHFYKQTLIALLYISSTKHASTDLISQSTSQLVSYSNSQLFRRHPTSFALRVLREHLGILPTEISAASSGCFQLGTGYDILGDRFKEGAEVFQFGEPIAGRLGIRSVANAVKIYLTSIWPLENLLYTLPILCRVPPGVQINFLSDTDTFM